MIYRYYDHPLSAATSAMLNLGGGGPTDDGIQMTDQIGNNLNMSSSFNVHPHQLNQMQTNNNLVYEYYKIPDKPTMQWR